jgi:hypothetical protein
LKSRRNFGVALKTQHHAAGVAIAREKLSKLVEIGQESKRGLPMKKSSQI